MSGIRTPDADRVQAPAAAPEDDFDRSLRPRRLTDFVGQAAVNPERGPWIA